MNQPEFTVLMAVYGGDDHFIFARALASIFSNTRLPNSVILVVDGPVSIDTQEIINQYVHRPDVIIVQIPLNRGLGEALNAGLEHVRTEWVVRADADDINRDDRFEILCASMDDTIDLLGSCIREVERDGRIICERRLPLNHFDIVKFMRRRNPFNHMTVAFRTNLARQCGGYPALHLREDYALWIRMYAQGARMKNLPQNLVDATAGRDMYDRRGGFRYAKGEWALQALLVKEGVKPPIQGFIDFVLRSIIFLAPRGLRRLVYEKLLRFPTNFE